MTSTRERQQRAAARARLAREMAERQAAAKKRRQRTIIIGSAVAVVLVLVGTVWAVTALTGDEPETPPAAQPTIDPTTAPVEGVCGVVPEDLSDPQNELLQDVGLPTPPSEDLTGVATMTFTTNLGDIVVEADTAQIPCTYASFVHLADQSFYDGSICHRMVTDQIYVLQCGDPTGTGRGGPAYRFAEENLPTEATPPYPRGVMAMAKLQPPSTTGSQFFIVYEDTVLDPAYTVVGTVIEGMDIVDEVVAAGHDGEADGNSEGYPNQELVIETFHVSEPS